MPYEILSISNLDNKPLNLGYYLDSDIISAKLNCVYNAEQAISFIKKFRTHIIFIDLDSFKDDGLEELESIFSFTTAIPIVIISNKLNQKFRMLCLEKGASDYIVKKHLDSFAIYNALRQNIDRPNYFNALEEAKSSYNQLFQLCPQPIFVYDLETLRIIDINEAVLRKYGYTYQEFLSKTMDDIRSDDTTTEAVKKAYEHNKHLRKSYRGILKHCTKNGELLDVEVHSSIITFGGKQARIVIAIDITKQLTYIKAIENQNKKLEEIAWTQSHVVRAPLVRMMSLVYMLGENFEDNTDFYLKEITKSAEDLDQIIHEITAKTNPDFEI
ncbi:PAS domain S-box protein [Zunongwangia sp. HRR-M8]|uniref:PAS domain S-box protein n=1 Tax=Zunongwangia sp. HRR-M8 TaxID=3015170 RepID=UPI0022DDBC5F|nr:PAS domain S-box protein [Zunongwangia sp. HRR-M8]WBL21360.1 PAS domain S-box protein [Zunongwangia sp. HRR-M8]